MNGDEGQTTTLDETGAYPDKVNEGVVQTGDLNPVRSHHRVLTDRGAYDTQTGHRVSEARGHMFGRLLPLQREPSRMN